jgi:hypothetical protein
MIDAPTFERLKARVAELGAKQAIEAANLYTSESGFTAHQPAHARLPTQVSKRRIQCAACARRLTADLVFEFVNANGKRFVYCAREDCAAL